MSVKTDIRNDFSFYVACNVYRQSGPEAQEWIKDRLRSRWWCGKNVAPELKDEYIVELDELIRLLEESSQCAKPIPKD